VNGAPATDGDRGPERPSYGLRADAERNHESILDAAVHLLAGDPAAGMAEIASASGIGRATLYRHFPTREDLFDAILQRAFGDAENAVAASRPEEGTATDALHRLVVGMLSLGDRYRFLFAQDVVFARREPGCDPEERLGRPIRALIERGQASGEFDASLPAAWMATAAGALIAIGIRDAALDRTRGRDLAEDVTRMVMRGISASEAQGGGGVSGSRPC
jgi:AcrR family transcriptional regulator